MEADEDLPTFRPFTREELATIDNRIFENKLAEKKNFEDMKHFFLRFRYL